MDNIGETDGDGSLFWLEAIVLLSGSSFQMNRLTPWFCVHGYFSIEIIFGSRFCGWRL